MATKLPETPILGKLSKKEKSELLKKSSKDTLEMAAYLKEHKLDPDKNWKDHPVHGEKIREWAKIIRRAERKLTHSGELESKRKKLVKPEVHPKTQTVKKAPNLYDYPDVDGKPMPRGMRKKYRSRMRALIKSNMPKEEAERRALQVALTWVPEEDPNTHRRSHLSDPEFEGVPQSIPSSKPSTEGAKTKKEKRSKKNRKEMAQKMKERRAIKIETEED